MGQLKRLSYFNLTPLDLFFSFRRERKSVFFFRKYHFQGEVWVKFTIKKLIPAQETVNDVLSCIVSNMIHSTQNMIKICYQSFRVVFWANLGPIKTYLCFPETDMCSRLMGIEKSIVSLFTSDWWQAPLSNDFDLPQHGFVWNMNRTDAEGGVKINKNNTTTTITTKQKATQSKILPTFNWKSF